jgi:hypothetical protein
MVLDTLALNGQVPFKYVKGYMPNISPDALFSFYQPVWAHYPEKSFPDAHKEMALMLIPDENCIDIRGYKIIIVSGKVIMHKDVWARSVDPGIID